LQPKNSQIRQLKTQEDLQTKERQRLVEFHVAAKCHTKLKTKSKPRDNELKKI